MPHTTATVLRIFIPHGGYRYLRELLIAFPKVSTADDYESQLAWRLTPHA